MIADKIKIKVSSYVADIIDFDARYFGFSKKGENGKYVPNRNALLNKLIPTLVELRKYRREQVQDILENEYTRKEGEKIYNCVNTIIDRVYFHDEELDNLVEDIWIRPTKSSISCFDEIEQSELKITALEMAVYIRSLLNEYTRFPKYKREALVFDKEMDDFYIACNEGRIFHFKAFGKSHRAFAYSYHTDYTLDQLNYLIVYDITDKIVCAYRLNEISNTFVVKQKFSCQNFEKLLKILEEYDLDCKFFDEITVENI